jgi:hypothetical protein
METDAQTTLGVELQEILFVLVGGEGLTSRMPG